MQWFSGPQLESLMSPAKARAATYRALEWQLDNPRAPLRTHLDSAWGPLLMMPLVLPHFTVIKVLTVRSHIAPTLSGALLVLDTATGEPLALFDGATVTGLRTAALAAVATKLLAPNRNTVSIIGAGYQARFHVAAMGALPGVRRIRLYNRTASRANALRDQLTPLLAISLDVAPTISDATQGADVITLITGADVPLIKRSMVTPLVHINAMGAYLPDRRECSSDLVLNDRTFADRLDQALQDAGDLAIPIREGSLIPDRVHALASLLHCGPPSVPGITLFKSVGSAEFDAFFAIAVMEQCRTPGA